MCREAHPEFACAGKRRKALLCAAFSALLIFLLINIGLALGAGKKSHGKPEERGATFAACDSAVRQFEQGRPPAVVIIGSSVMMAPLWSVDARRYPGVPDVYHHHTSIELEKLLMRQGLGEQPISSFALPGLMISDGYLITEKLLRGDKRPKLLVYGLAPRDFMDDLLTGETRTVVFQRLMSLSDLPSIGDLYLSTNQEKADFILNNLLFLYGKRWRYQDKAANLLKSALSRLLPGTVAAPASNQAKSEREFLLGRNRQEVWAKSIEEYRARYAHFNTDQFSKQEHFLDALIKTARERGIAVLLVNMPLTRDNLNLMPAGFYRQYRGTLDQLAARHHCDVLDLQSDKALTDSAFYDTVHLNRSGGDQLLRALSAWIASHETLYTAARTSISSR